MAENCPLLVYYAASGDNFLPTFRDIRSWNVGKKLPPLAVYPETSVRNYHHSLRNKSEERSSLLLRGGSLRPRRKKAILCTRDNCI